MNPSSQSYAGTRANGPNSASPSPRATDGHGKATSGKREYPWPMVKLGEVVTHRKEFITIDDEEHYRRCRVHLHAKGVVLRDIVEGAAIKTKKQQVCRAGEFLVAEIDAKVGGFGMVPPELEGAIVSSHYFLFAINTDVLDHGFLDYYCRTLAFREQFAARGSTNYAAVRPSHVLEYSIPLPPLPEQKRIVVKVQSLTSKIDEARELRSSVSDTLTALTTSLHAHFSEPVEHCFSEFVRLSEDRVKVEPSVSYPQIGIRAFGAGMFRKEAVSGFDTSYKHFNKLFPGALIVSQVKGWEGAVAVADDGLDGWFTSPEYRTFLCIPDRCDPTYLKHLVRTSWFHAKLSDATQGVGARRERVRPERLLATQISMPSFARQQVLASVLEQAARIADGQAACAKQLCALMPAVLDRAFKGQL